MKLKKTIAAITLMIMAVTCFTACTANNDNNDDQTEPGAAVKAHIYILTASEKRDWEGSVSSFANEKADEINDGGDYTAEVITASDAADQITKVDNIISKNEENIAVVIQPIDDTVQVAIQRLVDADIPYVAFDKIINDVSASAVANVKGDNEGVGAGTAAYFVGEGLEPGDRVYVYEGDDSSVTTLRSEGFTKYLTGEIKFDGKTIADDKKWTQDDLKALTYSGAMNWSRDDTKTSFETLMGNADNAKIKWFYSQDDDMTMGIFEALSGGNIKDTTKNQFLGNKPVITGCGGLDELYEILRGNSYTELKSQLGGLMSVTYSPSMIQTAIQDMVNHLEGKDVTKDHIIPCKIVTSENVEDFESFD